MAVSARLAELPGQTTAALLIGIDLGPNLSITGSLATLLAAGGASRGPVTSAP
jgi:Na+/H+ antiporter NhaD/arsenite permease-like protein